MTLGSLAKRFAVTACLTGMVFTGNALAVEPQSFLLATASTGGTYYPVGVAISTLTKVKLQPKMKIGMSAINSAGSGENVKLLRENEVQFAILQGLYGYYAWNGKGPLAQDGPQKEMRAVTMLWQNVEQFTILSKKAKTGTSATAVARFRFIRSAVNQGWASSAVHSRNSHHHPQARVVVFKLDATLV